MKFLKPSSLMEFSNGDEAGGAVDFKMEEVGKFNLRRCINCSRGTARL